MRDGVPVCTAAGNQQNPRIVADGTGGVIIAWQDRRGPFDDIYAQHLLADGAVAPGWPANGLAVCTASGYQENPQIAPDGAGGAIVTWQDARAGASAVYAQRVLAGGTVDPRWPLNGVALCSGPSAGQGLQQLVSDGAGGAIVAWQDSRNGSSDIYAQHVLADGTVAPGWLPAGVALCTAPGVQSNVGIAGDGIGGAIVTWHDARWVQNIYQIYAQRILSSGSVAPGWPDNGVALCTYYSSHIYPVIVSDGVGGAIVAWDDRRAGQPADPIFQDIYAQRVDGTGVPQWVTDGVSLCAAVSTQESPELASDRLGGAFVIWQDHRGSSYDIYAHHVLANGAPVPNLPADGVPVSILPGNQVNPQIVADEAGGAIVTWQDTPGTNYHIYAHHLLAAGNPDPAWPTGGAVVCAAANSQSNPQIAPDGSGGAIITWQDSRAGGTNPLDIYAQRVSDNPCADAPVPAAGQSCGVSSWTGPASGFYFDVANWNGGAGPVPNGTCPATCAPYDARFAIGGATYGIDFAGSPTSARVTVAAGDHPTFRLGGSTYRMSQLLLDGAGSSLRVSRGTVEVQAQVQVGQTNGSGPGLEIADGGAVTCGAAAVGAADPGAVATGRVTVRSGGMWRVDGALTVGGPGAGAANGILDLNDGCAACAARLHVGQRGQVNTASAALVVSGTALSRCAAQHGSGVLQGSSGVAFADTLEVEAGAAMDSVVLDPGGVMMSASSVARDLANSGTLSPGSQAGGVGTLVVNAGYTQAATGKLVIDLGGDTPGVGYDALHVAGPATLGGTLDWKLVNGYRPAIGQKFEVLVAHPLHGVFDAVSEGIDVAYTDTSVVLTATAATPTLASLVSAEAEPGRVSVRWLVSAEGGPVTIRRARETGAWEPVARRYPDGTGFVSYEDTDVTAGRYGYRLGLPSGTSEIAAGEVWVTVPSRSDFGLAGVSPHPASGPLTVSFSLGGTQPASLELFDLVGRRVEARPIESPRPGQRVLTLGAGRALPAGVYLLQLTQGTRRASCRVAVVR